MEHLYDVFLSHNRRSKPWVRRLHQCLCTHGLKVFFDEESVPPGASVVDCIEAALDQSRRIVLVLTPAALESKWVSLESRLGVYGDPDSSLGTVIPVVLEPVDLAKVRPSIRSLNTIDLTDPETRRSGLRRLLSILGVDRPQAGWVDSLSEEPQASAKAELLRVGGLDEVLEWGWSGEKLLERFIELDYATLDGLQAAHEGSPAQWAPIFMNHPETWRMLYSAREVVCGYWHFAPLFEDDYQLALNGRLVDSAITPDRIRVFELPGEYSIYFVQLCMGQTFRYPSHVRQLFMSMLQVLERLAGEGIFIKEICANAYTGVGRSICRTFGLAELCSHAEHGVVHAAPIKSVLSSNLATMNTRLTGLYREQGLL